MTDAPPIKVEIILEPWQAELLRTVDIPDGLCGPSVSERAAFILDEWCEHIKAERERRATHPHEFENEDDDDVPF